MHDVNEHLHVLDYSLI